MSPGATIRIREASDRDASTVHELLASMAASTPSGIVFGSSREDIERAMASKPPALYAFIARNDARPVGVLTLFPSFSTWRGTAGVYIQDIYVHESARGTGIGHRLLASACRWGLERGADHLRLSVDRSNRAARTFYEHRDFSACDEESIYMIADEAFRKLGKQQ